LVTDITTVEDVDNGQARHQLLVNVLSNLLQKLGVYVDVILIGQQAVVRQVKTHTMITHTNVVQVEPRVVLG
jgi:hypothetical protein